MIARCVKKPVVATEETIILIIGANAYGMSVFLENTGLNELNYKFQQSTENEDASYADISGASGVLQPGDVVLEKIDSSLPYIRLRAWAPGNSELMIGITQWFKNVSNIQPIINI